MNSNLPLPHDLMTYTNNTPISKAMKGGHFRKNRMLKNKQLNDHNDKDFNYANIPDININRSAAGK